MNGSYGFTDAKDFICPKEVIQKSQEMIVFSDGMPILAERPVCWLELFGAWGVEGIEEGPGFA